MMRGSRSRAGRGSGSSWMRDGSWPGRALLALERLEGGSSLRPHSQCGHHRHKGWSCPSETETGWGDAAWRRARC